MSFLFHFCAQVGAVDPGGNGRMGADKRQGVADAAVGEAPVGNTPEKAAPFRSPGYIQGGVEGGDHGQDAYQDPLFHFGIGILGKIHGQQDGDHDQGPDFPVDAEQQVHAGSAAGNVPESEEQTGQEQADTHKGRRPFAVIVADGVDDGHARQHGNPVAGEHEGDAHKENRDEQPQHVIAVVGPQHGSGSDGSRTDDHPGQDDAGADPFQHLQKSQFGNGFRVEAQMFNVHDLISLWQAPGFFPSPYFQVLAAAFYNRLYYCSYFIAFPWAFRQYFLILLQLIARINISYSKVSCALTSLY